MTKYAHSGRIEWHRRIAERALGRPLTRTEQVHHVDGNRHNNVPSNLVICPNRSYHTLLHLRTEALVACGNANYRKCTICKEYDDPKSDRMYNSLKYRPNGQFLHYACARGRKK